MSNVRQLRGSHHSNIPAYYDEFVRDQGAPDCGIVILVAGGVVWCKAFTPSDARMSQVIGNMEIAKVDLIKAWRSDDEGD